MCVVNWPHKNVWSVKIPLKINMFLWLYFHNSILTKDVLIRREWKGKSNKCCFCDELLETIDHIFLIANWLGTSGVWSSVPRA